MGASARSDGRTSITKAFSQSVIGWYAVGGMGGFQPVGGWIVLVVSRRFVAFEKNRGTKTTNKANMFVCVCIYSLA